jgi:ABC-type nitrate/sulfonate/bicarbonate transport system permease component
LQALRQVPLLDWFPVFIMLFGVSEVSKTLLVTLKAFWWILIGTVSAVRKCIFMTSIGLLVNYILVALEKRLCGWQEEITES